MNKVASFYENYDSQQGLGRFLEEIIVQQLLDKVENPTDGEAISSAWQAYFMYDIGFERAGKIFQMMGSKPLPDPDNTAKRKIQVIEDATCKSINLNAFYLDQHSDTTIIATGGFRGNGYALKSHRTWEGIVTEINNGKDDRRLYTVEYPSGDKNLYVNEKDLIKI